MALRTTCIKILKLKIMKIRIGCQYVGYFHYSIHLNWAAKKLRLGCMLSAGRGLDIAAGPVHAQMCRTQKLKFCKNEVDK